MVSDFNVLTTLTGFKEARLQDYYSKLCAAQKRCTVFLDYKD